MGIAGGSSGKNPPSSAGDSGDTGLIPGSGRSSGGGNGNPRQYFCLGNPVDRGAWGELQSMRSQRVGHDLQTENAHTHVNNTPVSLTIETH